MPEGAENVVEFENGLKVTARAFTDKQTASESFGFNIRKAGILPVQITFQNDSEDQVSIEPDQTFLIDDDSQAWPLLSLDQTYQRSKKHVEVGETAKGAAVPSLLLGSAGAVAGAAIGIVTGSNVGEAMGKGAAVGAATGAVSGGAKSYTETGRKIREDIKSKSLGNRAIQPGHLSYGILFFPGTPGEEAQSASRLRVSLKMGTRQELVVINLK
ncbi:MAG: hypothetical protein ACLFV2_10635 [Desulfurivibrionaceae bacterium]